jgi:hypothetical protein
MARPQIDDVGTAPIRRVAVNILNKQSRTTDKGRACSLEIGRGANNFSLHLVTKHLDRNPRTWTDTLVLRKQCKSDMRFGTWNVRSLQLLGIINVEFDATGQLLIAYSVFVIYLRINGNRVKQYVSYF